MSVTFASGKEAMTKEPEYLGSSFLSCFGVAVDFMSEGFGADVTLRKFPTSEVLASM